MLSSLYVAASMPENVDVHLVDEDIEEIDFTEEADLVGISFMTYNAPRAYAIAARFRARGTPVIAGGYHPTMLPEEALQHVDAVCVGEAETTVPRLISDFQEGVLKPIYHGDLADLSTIRRPRRDLLTRSKYGIADFLQATRGCPQHCSFCSIAAFNRYKFRFRPVDDVVDEARGLRKNLLFMDDNIIGSRRYALALFDALAPLGKRWFSQCSIQIAFDDDLLSAAVRSGCRGLFVGFESLSQRTLNAVDKRGNRARDYKRAVRTLHQHGVAVFGGFVFGWDSDGPEVFGDTLDFAFDAGLDAIQATTLTPFPGTPLFDQMRNEGRITDYDWAKYDFGHTVYAPRHMSPETLERGVSWVLTQFYGRKPILARSLAGLRYLDVSTLLKGSIPINLGYRYRFLKSGRMAHGAQFQA
jgi:radical SAM superfamily enzyme YgiQ (UPF0313 family)